MLPTPAFWLGNTFITLPLGSTAAVGPVLATLTSQRPVSIALNWAKEINCFCNCIGYGSRLATVNNHSAPKLVALANASPSLIS